jgi:uncharacterized Zn finger protein
MGTRRWWSWPDDDRIDDEGAPMKWAQQWRDVLATDTVGRRRLSQGRAWDRSGRVTQVRATAGLLQGRVQGSAATPYGVDIGVGEFTDAQWDQVLDVLGGQARHHAHLLAGLPPSGLEEQLVDLGLALLPVRGELDTDCACADSTWPCVHVAAVWDAAAALLEDDPFLIFRLRGRGRQRLMADLADRRRGTPTSQGVAVSELPAQGWASLQAPLDDVALPAVEPAHTHAPLLRLLGDPPGWEGRVSAWELFSPFIAAAATAAGNAGEEPPGEEVID